MRATLAALLFLCRLGWSFAPVDVVNKAWPAKWIAVPGSPPQDYGVYHFRRTFELTTLPAHLMVYVSGDNRYQLFVNGTQVAWGPARGDLTHWRYETVDLAAHLRTGRNVLAAVVWNEGEQRAIAQVTNRTGFLLQAADSEQSVVNTGRGWKCLADAAYAPQLWPRNQRTGYYALGPNERLDGKLYPWGWEKSEFDDGAWRDAEELSPGAARDLQDGPNRWMLVPSAIPLEEQKTEQPLRASDGPELPLTLPAHSETASAARSRIFDDRLSGAADKRRRGRNGKFAVRGNPLCVERREGQSERGDWAAILRTVGYLPGRRSARAHLPAFVLADLSVYRTGPKKPRTNRCMCKGCMAPSLRIHSSGAATFSVSDAAPNAELQKDSVNRLAHCSAVRARDVHGLPVL